MASAAVAAAGIVDDLSILSSTVSSVTIGWTEVANGAGAPAAYRVKYALPRINWNTASLGCGKTITGAHVGARISCTVDGLQAGTQYEFQLMSFRSRGGTWHGAQYSNVATARTATSSAAAVGDLTIESTGSSSLTLRWTQVDDGSGHPASYRVKYGTQPFSWSTATIACGSTLVGTAIGAPMSCKIEGLLAGTGYDVQLMSFRVADGVWEGAAHSNVVHGTTTGTETAGAGVARHGIWLDHAQLMQRPTSGSAWSRVLADAARDPGRANIADQDSNHDVYTLAAALACARDGQHCAKARQGVLDAIGTEAGARWLAVGRNLGAYVIAADILDLRRDGVPNSDGSRVQAWMESWLTKRLLDNNTSVLRTIEPFHASANAAAQEGFVFAAVAAYLDDRAALERVWNAFRTYACDPAAPDDEHIYLDPPVRDGWTHDSQRPCAVNPAGTRKTVAGGLPGAGGTYRIDGALVGDMRRGGVFQWKPGYTSYPWVGLEGFVPAAVILERAGYPAFQIADKAVLRTHEYLWQLRNATGETRWFDGTRAREIVHLVNVVYHASFPVNDVTGGGRTVGYTAWTHPTW
ncbi:MAG: fibronectin type III domain-containing protein [Gemmatimonadales bacterium]